MDEIMHAPLSSRIAIAVASVVCFFCGNHLCGLYMSRHRGILDAMSYMTDHFADSFNPLWPAFHFVYIDYMSLMIGLVCLFIPLGAWMWKIAKGTYRHGEEYGSSRWATDSEMKAFGDWEVPLDNTILARGVLMSYRNKKDFEKTRNNNVLVVGGSGSGKTRGYVKPNIMQIACPEMFRAGKSSVSPEDEHLFFRSYVITDPKGATRPETGYLFASHGIPVREFNVIDWGSSDHYNPLRYLRNSTDSLIFVNCLISNTNAKDQGTGGDPFWEKSEVNFLHAIIEYMRTELPASERNIPTLLKLVDLAKVDETRPNDMDGLDILFYEVESGLDYDPEQKGSGAVHAASGRARSADTRSGGSEWVNRGRKPRPDHEGVTAYNSYKVGAPQTKQSVLTTVKVRLAPLRPAQVQEVLSDDALDIDKFGDTPMVLYAIPHDQDKTYNFLIAILIWQMLKVLSDRAIERYQGSGAALPVGVSFIMDEAANFYIPGLDNISSTCRSRNIGLTIILQALSQLETVYDENRADTIMNNCDSMVFLGGKSQKTNKMLEETIGQQTVSTDNASQQHGMNGSWSEQHNQHGRALTYASEIAQMPRSQCLVLITGGPAWRGPKYDPADHPMYKYLDPNHKGAVYPRMFSMRAYRSNPLYYRRDAELSCRVWTGLSIERDMDSGSRAVQFRWHLDIQNTSDSAVAYDVQCHIETSAVCLTCEELKRKGRRGIFPDFENHGWGRCGWDIEAVRTSKEVPEHPDEPERGMKRTDAHDCIAYRDVDGSAVMSDVDLPPRSHVLITVVAEAPEAAVLPAVRTGLELCGLDAVRFELGLEGIVRCANADGELMQDRSVVSMPAEGEITKSSSSDGRALLPEESSATDPSERVALPPAEETLDGGPLGSDAFKSA